MPELNIKLIIDGREANATLSLTKEQLSDIAKQASQAGTSTTSSLGNIGSIITGINQGLELAKKGFEILSQPLEAAGQFEQYETSLKVMLGSTEAAKARLVELVEFAKSTPFELPQVVQAANQLQAIGKYSEENLRMLGDLASASGKPMEQALSAYSKLMTGQKGVAIDMFRDLLISATDWAEATGAKIGANGELQASVEQMAEALPKILQKKGFDGMMQAQSETFNGMISNMKDAFGQFETALGQKLLPIGKQVAQILSGLASSITPVKTNLESTTETAHNQRLEFEKLIIQYEDLRGKAKKTNEETERYNGIIKVLQERYPDILGKMDLQKGKLDDLRIGFQQVRSEMEKNIRLELDRAKAKDIVEEQQKFEGERDKSYGRLLDAQSKLNLIRQGTDKDELIQDPTDPDRRRMIKKSVMLTQYVESYTKQVEDAKFAIKAKQFELDNILSGLPDEKTPPPSKSNSGSGTTVESKAGKKLEQERKDAENAAWEMTLKEVEWAEDRANKTGEVLEKAVENKSRQFIEESEAAVKLDKKKEELHQKELYRYREEAAKKQVASASLIQLDQMAANERLRLSGIDEQIRQAKTENEVEDLQRQRELTEQKIDLAEQEKQARLDAAKANIEAGMQQYNAEKSLGEQMKELIRQRIIAIIAEAVMTQIAKVIATVPWPLNLILAPVAGLALQGLLEGLIPKFEKGGLAPAGQLVLMNEKGSEYIVNAQATKEYLPYLQAMNSGIDPFNSLLNARMALTTAGGGNLRLLEDIRNLLREAPRYKIQIGDRDASDINLRADRRLYKES